MLPQLQIARVGAVRLFLSVDAKCRLMQAAGELCGVGVGVLGQSQRRHSARQTRGGQTRGATLAIQCGFCAASTRVVDLLASRWRDNRTIKLFKLGLDIFGCLLEKRSAVVEFLFPPHFPFHPTGPQAGRAGCAFVSSRRGL